jgi:hypothetical protein
MRFCAIALALLSAGTAISAQPAAMVYLGAQLDGKQQPAKGDSDGWGSWLGELRPQDSAMCYTLVATRIQLTRSAGLYHGMMGSKGQLVLPLAVTGPDADRCVQVDPALLSAMIDSPAAYYVDLINPQFPGGAIRGQLARKQ